MIDVKTGISADEVRFAGNHVLFVEGKDKAAVDPKVLRDLVGNTITIQPLGPSYYVKSVAQALSKYHPTYYFLIDRDHHDDQAVESCWANFPDPNTHNLLIWRKREIENYFLDPTFLFHSKFVCVSQQLLNDTILQDATRRLFLEVTNAVIVSIREEFKRSWIVAFTNPDDFSTFDRALSKLRATTEFQEFRNTVTATVADAEIVNRFNLFYAEMTGGKQKLEFGSGNWLERMQGKKILGQVVNSNCFQVRDSRNNHLAGREKLNEVVKDLLQKDDANLPTDFTQLKRLIDQRIKAS